MKTNVRFTGREDFRELGPDDLVKAGVEDFPETAFGRDQVTEVSTKAIADALVNNPELYGTFEIVEDEEPAPEPEKPAKKSAAKADPEGGNVDAKADGSSQIGTTASTTTAASSTAQSATKS